MTKWGFITIQTQSFFRELMYENRRSPDFKLFALYDDLLRILSEHTAIAMNTRRTESFKFPSHHLFNVGQHIF